MDLAGGTGLSFVARSAETGVLSLEWRVWSQRTNFYLKPRDPLMGLAKFSLHGPDPAIPNSPWWKFAVDHGTPPDGSGTFYSQGGSAPKTIRGRKITGSVTHVLRFRYIPLIFTGPMRSPPPRPHKAGNVGALLAAPTDGSEVWVDVFVADAGTEPYFLDTAQTKAANAGIGPLLNSAGQALTIIARKRPLNPSLDPTEETINWDRVAVSGSDPVRAVQVLPDSTGLMWITERDLPREAFVQIESDRSVFRSGPSLDVSAGEAGAVQLGS